MRAALLVLALAACRTPPLDRLPDLAAPLNACGGVQTLAFSPGAACGACGSYRCDGSEQVICDDSQGLNACGACGPTLVEECNGRDDNCNGVVDEGCPYRVEVSDASDEIHPRVRGDQVVFDQGSSVMPLFDFAMVTLPGQSVTLLTKARTGRPSFDGTLLAWADDAIVAFDFGTATYVPYPASGVLIGTSAAVDGGRVAFSDSQGKVGIWDTVAGTATRIADGQGDVALSAQVLAFVRAGDVWVHDLGSAAETNLSDGLGGVNDSPAIDGAQVVWHHQGNATDEIYAYDLGAQARRQLTAGPAIEPRISGALVCWAAPAADTRWGAGVTVHDLVSDRELALGGGGHCDIDGRRVVWSDARYSFDIFGQDLLDNQP